MKSDRLARTEAIFRYTATVGRTNALLGDDQRLVFKNAKSPKIAVASAKISAIGKLAFAQIARSDGVTSN
jgi:hypothetical protein